jgi:putative Mn2+ efflux pump MntP
MDPLTLVGTACALAMDAFAVSAAVAAGLSRVTCERDAGFDPTRGLSLVVLSIATSIDALAVGISLGLIGVSIWLPVLVIGLVTMALCYIAVRVGRQAGDLLGPWAERLGGLVLVAISIRMMIAL